MLERSLIALPLSSTQQVKAIGPIFLLSVGLYNQNGHFAVADLGCVAPNDFLDFDRFKLTSIGICYLFAES